ncbi:MAG: HAMP domain-containing histidine kinase [Oscillospiraceae bacterium]|jgi:signal transduction histidine kinase|nr:HAMP domain-containing histidine kinase [Oscillospiraceae bacterium]
MKQKSNSLVKRWIFNVVILLALATLVLAAAFLIIIARNYRMTVERTLSNQTGEAAVLEFFKSHAGENGENFERAAVEYVENFSVRDQLELWVIDDHGLVVASSSGTPQLRGNQMEDYQAAMAPGSGGSAFWQGKYNGQSVMACTVIYTLQGSHSTVYDARFALRYMISLKHINAQIGRIAVLTLIVWLLMMAMVIVSGFYFIRSILRPLARISQTASKLANGELEERVAPSGRRDEIARLGQDVNHMADEIASADKMKLDFISTISHELRTPLTAIKGWGETLRDAEKSDPALHARGLQIIIDEAGRLTHLVEELLDFSRLQSKRLVMHKERMDALAELDDAVFIFRERAGREGVELICASSDIPATMLGDPARIRQVFINVLDNAFKYTPQGGKVTVTTEFEPPLVQLPPSMTTQKIPIQLPKELHVTIHDTGCGVCSEDLPHITEKFFKSSTATKGSGIGLAVVAEVLRFHDCVLTFESPPGQGLAVKMVFPLLDAGEKI